MRDGGTQNALEASLPPRVVVGTNGAYWRVFPKAGAEDEGFYSMCPTSTDNDPVEVVAVYELVPAIALRCAKCGGAKIVTRWHTGGRYGNGGCGYYAKVVGHGEHLHRTCTNCQYEWTEPTNDA